MTILDPVISTEAIALATLTECVCNELATTGAGPTCWCGMYPGAIVSWEYCGECAGELCGMGWVRVASTFPYETFPLPIVEPVCPRPLAWMIEVGALRCVPTPAGGEIPDPATMSDVALRQLADAQALYRAVLCCNDDPHLTWAVQNYVPVGPQGGCVGGFWTVFLGVD